MPASPVLAWLHIGDLHITGPGEENLEHLHRIVALAASLPTGSLDFAFLPGDIADNGLPAQFALVRDAIAPLRACLPVHAIPGDHDIEPGDIGAFHAILPAPALPAAIAIQGRRCLFLDAVSAGSGGPDFRLGQAQTEWLEAELDQAEAARQDAAIFIHTYPADLREGRESLQALLSRPNVLTVDMGHTHYNELANDGGTIFMATRSTGQIEEGPPGFSIAVIDGGNVNWRFVTLDDPWPQVLITTPADRRLATAASGYGGMIRAKILGDAPIDVAEMQLPGTGWSPLRPTGDPTIWEAPSPPVTDRLTVRARDTQGRTGFDTIEPLAPGWQPPTRAADGSDRDSVGAWPDRHLLGTQLGPNRNGRKW